MPSDSVVEFLDLARQHRLLSAADLDRLADQPDADLHGLCDRLVAGGQLTRFQADRVLTGRGYALTFAGYPLLDELDDTTYRAVEPTTGGTVLLRRFRTNTPADAQRVATAAGLTHPHLSGPLAAGELGGEGYLVYSAPDGADLAALVADMGPMPALLAAEYVRQAATGLAAAHAAGVVHGSVRSERLFVGPLVLASKPKPDGSPRFRPSPAATVTVADFGLPLPADAVPTPADDVFHLGEVLFHLLTGNLPADSGLSAVRPDCPDEVAAVVQAMLAPAPADRPSAADVVTRLTGLLAPNGRPASEPAGVPINRPSDPEASLPNVQLAETEQVELVNEPMPALALADGWAGHPAVVSTPAPAFIPPAWAPLGSHSDPHPSAEVPYPPRRSRTAAGGSRKMLWVWAVAFLVLAGLGVLVWVVLIASMNSPARSYTPPAAGAS